MRSICSRYKWWRQPVLVLGTPAERGEISQWLNRQWFLGLRAVDYTESRNLYQHPTRVIIGPSAAFDLNFEGDISWIYPRTTHIPGVYGTVPQPCLWRIKRFGDGRYPESKPTLFTTSTSAQARGGFDNCHRRCSVLDADLSASRLCGQVCFARPDFLRTETTWTWK